MTALITDPFMFVSLAKTAQTAEQLNVETEIGDIKGTCREMHFQDFFARQRTSISG